MGDSLSIDIGDQSFSGAVICILYTIGHANVIFPLHATTRWITTTRDN